MVGAAPGGSSGQSNPSPQGGGVLPLSADGPAAGSSGGTVSPSSIPDTTIDNLAGLVSFPYFDVYVHDNNNGVVLWPGVEQLATLNGWVDLVAQVSGATVSSYSWTISPSTVPSFVSGTSTDQLNFRWPTEVPVPGEVTVTLAVTDTSSQIETYTYDFWLPSDGNVATGSGGGGTNATWPTSLAPSQELESAPSFASNNATVDATSGSLDTEIDLPSYNPNVPAYGLDLRLDRGESGANDYRREHHAGDRARAR